MGELIEFPEYRHAAHVGRAHCLLVLKPVSLFTEVSFSIQAISSPSNWVIMTMTRVQKVRRQNFFFPCPEEMGAVVFFFFIVLCVCLFLRFTCGATAISSLLL